ncbi:glutamate formiminotransferase/formiminotetrahydrofolate cyclodeaminase [Lewinella aquimaris]|uniref:glutamate formimidoyltransferase n=1 Tax=Neolewinella aquimaris TaxID=1835722 RepID=A0A840EDC6_9BACT|nr:glutamate formimidoyltransferase [Neolewinella aquimaris]MBB4079809.1 glutamate formiminotransferase/formiminotetrahydrofolate cyclodeaminase [Neolewinella aquimaris]
MPTPAAPLIECVINVSEGRDLGVLDRMSEAIDSVDNCYLLHRDIGHGAHRTVFTFAGAPEGVYEAAFHLYRIADEHLDMRRHRGTHPRSGAIDVCPLVPIANIQEAEVRAGTQELAKMVAERFNLPVYLYENSAALPHRANLAAVRKGEFEGLTEKMQLPDWQPDFGPSTPHPRLGITIMGTRPFLIAWNINLSAEATPEQANQLAARLRGSGAAGRPGLFPGLKAIGWYIEEYGRCQVSCNVVDPDQVSLARVYLTATDLAAAMGIKVTGSELIGLIPARHLRAAARNFSFSSDYEEEMDTAVSILGLADLEPFNWRQRVLEEVYRFAAQTDRRNQ